MKTKETIKFNLIRTNFYTRRYCHICVGMTEKDEILCEVTEGEHKGTRACPRCLEYRGFDKRLEATAQELEKEAEYTRSLIGRLEIPSFDEYNQRTLGEEAKYEKTNY